ncbi:hypothetical protein E5288_WYG015060 [Bos mutus]|uniref:Uncharacterized protein n=1 Tax=Bos mutus TaxID=72004 RepID=A0A6B0RKA4_9CETA|nr:hypothetical protein [Bos mutus]
MLRTPDDFTAVKSAQVTREQEDPFFCWSNFIKQILKCYFRRLTKDLITSKKEHLTFVVMPMILKTLKWYNFIVTATDQGSI